MADDYTPNDLPRNDSPRNDLTLRGFLAENAVKVQTIKHIVSNRFLDDNGNPIEWEIGCITTTEDEALRTQATKRIPIPGKRGRGYTEDLDAKKYLGNLAVRCTLYPNLNDAGLQNSYNVMGADVLLKTMLTPGEYADYLLKIQEINGFDVTFEEQVEEAKN